MWFDCEECGHEVLGTPVTVEEQLLVAGRHVVVTDVPAGACEDCGALHTGTEVDDALEEIVAAFRLGRLGASVRFPGTERFIGEDAA